MGSPPHTHTNRKVKDTIGGVVLIFVVILRLGLLFGVGVMLVVLLFVVVVVVVIVAVVA